MQIAETGRVSVGRYCRFMNGSSIIESRFVRTIWFEFKQRAKERGEGGAKLRRHQTSAHNAIPRQNTSEGWALGWLLSSRQDQDRERSRSSQPIPTKTFGSNGDSDRSTPICRL
ncbi:hypothetical protein H310_05679 [Aphanomyces invadans]|uniref:Uncharacterized protein n=1 Tax=Aphanomyces invadans TaxID=157072 RepID=A0A024U842_9STRA|nr:hypothetical protein H310_05679 [Aphanomyces invadans]ETW02067.1 hypothetical protein H310_05679 [Aphanomyces invadans]|eukprot:XP_008868672.1 hypothetical protein H310_05679 [Aphanomyces invadans]